MSVWVCGVVPAGSEGCRVRGAGAFSVVSFVIFRCDGRLAMDAEGVVFFRAHVFPQIGLFQAFWQPDAYAVRFIYSGAGKKQENHDDRYGKENAGKGFSG